MFGIVMLICAIIGFGIFALTSTQTESVISADIPLVSREYEHKGICFRRKDFRLMTSDFRLDRKAIKNNIQ